MFSMLKKKKGSVAGLAEWVGFGCELAQDLVTLAVVVPDGSGHK